MATAKKSTEKKVAAPKPGPEVLSKLENLNMELTLVKAGSSVKVYNHGTNEVLDGTVLAVHEGFRIDVLVSIPGKESESLPTVNHISKSGSPSDLFWDN